MKDKKLLRVVFIFVVLFVRRFDVDFHSFRHTFSHQLFFLVIISHDYSLVVQILLFYTFLKREINIAELFCTYLNINNILSVTTFLLRRILL